MSGFHPEMHVNPSGSLLLITLKLFAHLANHSHLG